MGVQAKTKALLVLLCAAVTILAMAGAGEAVANRTAWQRIEDAAAEWELPVDAELHRHIGSAAAGELLYANAVGPGALVPNRPSYAGGRCAGNGGRWYSGRGCYKIFGCG
ncbi:hypothetical protein ABZP36_004304 [Zizania latifolia]